MAKFRTKGRQGDLGKVDVFQARGSVGASAVANTTHHLILMHHYEATRQSREHLVVPVMWALMSERLFSFHQAINPSVSRSKTAAVYALRCAAFTYRPARPSMRAHANRSPNLSTTTRAILRFLARPGLHRRGHGALC